MGDHILQPGPNSCPDSTMVIRRTMVKYAYLPLQCATHNGLLLLGVVAVVAFTAAPAMKVLDHPRGTQVRWCKSRCAVTKVRPILAPPVWQRGPGTMLGKMLRRLREIGFQVFRFREFKILNAKRWMEPEITFGLGLPLKNVSDRNLKISGSNLKSRLA